MITVKPKFFAESLKIEQCRFQLQFKFQYPFSLLLNRIYLGIIVRYVRRRFRSSGFKRSLRDVAGKHSNGPPRRSRPPVRNTTRSCSNVSISRARCPSIMITIEELFSSNVCYCSPSKRTCSNDKFYALEG